jgi:ubiquitin-protein ligase
MMSQKSIFSLIANKLISKYSIKSKLIPTFRYIENGKSLYILLKYKKKSEYNVFNTMDLYFSINLDDKFPDSLPYVRALTNFSHPSLYDNSNLYQNIILFKDSNLNSKTNDPFLIIEDIILGIPLLLDNIKKNQEDKRFYYYGEYSLDEIYDINDFFTGQNVEFFRVKQIIKKNEFKRYIILNDVYFLLFDPVPDSNNYAKLVFISDILLLNNTKEDQNEKIINFEWKKEDNDIKMSFKFENIKFSNFILAKNNRKEKLFTEYNINNNSNYNTKGFQISKSFECEIMEE